MEQKPEFIVLRENEKVAGNVSLERYVYVMKDGLLEQNLSINERDIPVDAREWHFEVKGSHDTLLSSLDQHWRRLRREFNTLAEEAAYYHHAKTNSPLEGDERRREFVISTATKLSSHLLAQTIPDEELTSGEIAESNYPVTTISQRMGAMRATARSMKIPLDSFEKHISSLNKYAHEAVALYEKAMLGNDDGSDNGQQLQSTAADSEYDNEDAWRGEGEDEDTPPYEEQDCEECSVDGAEAWRESLDDNDAEKEPWQDDDHDPDDERDEQIDDLLEDFMNYVMDFTHLANRLWMDAVVQIKEGQPVTLNKQQIAGMEKVMLETQQAYEKFKEASQDTAAGQYELKEVYDQLEDPERGIQARMQKLISMASRPQQLEETIKRALPKGLER
jgi:hypothetical protein